MTATETDAATAELESYLSDELGVELVGTEVLHDGLNLTLAISTETGEEDRKNEEADEHEPEYVLRRPNKLRHTELFDSVKQEYELMRRLQETAVPTPEPVLYCDDESILGDHFFVMTRLDGAVVPLGSDLPERFQDPTSRRRVADLLIDTLADVHSLGVEPFAEVCERQTALDQVEHATDRLDEATSVTGHELPKLRSVGDWLRENAPSNAETTLVHGDYRPGNILFAGGDQPEITGVLDWETAMLGDPLTELGYFLLRWRDDGDPTPSLDDLEMRYADTAIQDVREMNENGLAPFTAKPGSPTRREVVARYEKKTGITFENDRFYQAHAAFMLATVWEDLDRYQVEARGKSDREQLVEYMAMLAESIVSGEFQL